MTDPYFEYRDFMRGFYSRMAEFIKDRPDFLEGLTRAESFFRFLNMTEDEKREFVLDWFIFDPKSKVRNKRVLNHYLDDLDDPDQTYKRICEGFKNGLFGLFEAKAIRIGKEMIVHDLVNDRDFQVRDESATRHLAKGQCALLRVLPYKDHFILTGRSFVFPKDVAPVLKISIRQMKEAEAKNNRKLTIGLFEMCRVFFAQEKRESLPPIERFRLICEEAGLSAERIDEALDQMREKAAAKSDHQEILTDLYKDANPHKMNDIKELSSCFIEVCNGFISQNDPGAEKGPMEQAIIGLSLDRLRSQVQLSEPDAQAKMNQLQKEWFQTPLDEFGGRTPVQMILEERTRLGNPQKEVGFRIALTELRPGEALEQKAEETFHRAIDLSREQKFGDAIAAYEEHLQIHPTNYVAWLNKGVCHALLLDKKSAISCFKRALDINPKYEMAKRNLLIYKTASDADLKRMANEFRVTIINEGKTIESE